jgi:hypothetical protein
MANETYITPFVAGERVSYSAWPIIHWGLADSNAEAEEPVYPHPSSTAPTPAHEPPGPPPAAPPLA